MATVPHTFASLAGQVPASYLDENFEVCADKSALETLQEDVDDLPSATTPLKPVAGGAAGAGATLSRADHQHPPQAALPNLQTGTSYTIASTDDGGVVELSNAAAIALTLPNNLPAGFSCLVVQVAAGQVTFAAQSGGTMRQRQSYSKTAGQWAGVTAYVRANVGGTAAEWVLIGDMGV